MRIAELLGEKGQHRFEHARIERGRRLIVEINRHRITQMRFGPAAHGSDTRAHAARTLTSERRQRRYRAVHARRKWATSASVEFQPRLTRIVEQTRSGRTSIALSTWLGPTFPEEQAAPALTMTPSRSSAMT